MNAQQLKNSILQMAVQGKLVPQDPNDEPASVLLERIRKEKEKLIKEGIIKKEKKPSYIFRGEDNLPYEKIGKNEPVCIADEVPFEIPDSWVWIRFKNLVNYSMGKTPPRKESKYWENPCYPWVSIADMIDGSIINTTKEQVNQYSYDKTFKGRLSPEGTLLMSFKLTVGKVSILGIDAFHNEAIISIFPYIFENNTIRDYLFETLPLLSKAGDTKTAIKGNTLNSESLDALLIPLPPLQEEIRIVNKLRDLKDPILNYDALETASSEMRLSFPDKLKKSILQQAVMGKLVSQDPIDEPACVLLERIRAEKQALIKVGKLKKDKHESIIYRKDNSHFENLDGVERCIDDEIPFEIPDNWCWCRVGSVFSIERGSSPRPIQNYLTNSPEGVNWIKIGDSEVGEKYITSTSEKITTQGALKSRKVNVGDMIFSNSMSFGRPYIMAIDGYVHDGWNILHIFTDVEGKQLIDKDYIYYVFCSELLRRQIANKVAGGVVLNIKTESLKGLLIPLPPLEEQHRIVVRIEELLSYCVFLAGKN